MDTIRNKAALLALLSNNNTGDISAQDMRDVVVTMYHDMEATGVLGPYLYIAYALDSVGTGFTTTFNSTYNFIAFLNSPTEILSLVQSDFNGLWSKYMNNTSSGTGSGTETLQDVTYNGNTTTISIVLKGATDGLNKISLLPIDNNGGSIIVYDASGIASTTISGTTGITSTSFIRSGGLSTQFLKADGSVDSTIYQTSLINGLADVLSINTNTGNLPITSPSGLNYLQINDTDFYAESGISNKGFLQMHEAFAAIGNNDGAFLVSDINLLYNYGKFQIRTLYSEIRHTTKVQINAPIITLSQNGVGALEAVTVQQLTSVVSAYVPLAGATMTGSLILNGDPTSANMAVNKNYVDQNLNGLNWKRSVLYSTTSGENLPLTGLTATIDGTSRTLSNTDRILVKNQTTGSQNGLYNPNAAAWTRTTDADTSTELLGATVYVLDGSIEKNRVYAVNVNPITLGTTNITFALISGVGTYTNGLYLKLTGNVFDIDFTTFSTANIIEGTNLYYTNARFDTAFSAKSTTNLTEGINLYYTQTRFDTAFTLKTTTDLTEGTNLYYTQARFDTAFTLKTTTDLTEGTNLYFTNSRAISSVLTGYVSSSGIISAADSILSAIQKLNGNTAALVTGVSSVFGRTGAVVAVSGDYTTTLVTEGTNLYYTQARFDTAFSAKSTTNLSEGTNLYFTNARAISSTLTGYISGAGLITSADSILSALQKSSGNVSGTTNYIAKFNSAYSITDSIIFDNGTYVGIGTTSPAAKFHISGGTINQRLEPISGITEDVTGATVNTTDATSNVTLQTIAVPLNTSIIIKTIIKAIKTSGTGSGTVGQCCAFERIATYQNIAGVVTIAGVVQTSYTSLSISGLDSTLIISGTNVLITVTGVVNDNITWTCVTRTY